MKPKPSGPNNLFLALGIIHILASIAPAYTLPFTFDHFIYALRNSDHFGNGYWDSLYNVHLSMLFGPFAFASACFLLANKKIGWAGTIISIVCNSIVLIAVLMVTDEILNGTAFILLLIPVLLLLLEISCFVLLWKEKQRKAFKVDTNTIVITSGLLFLLICDGIWGYLNVF